MGRNNKITFLNYINAVKKNAASLPVSDIDFGRFIKANAIIDSSFDYSKATFYVLDYNTGLYNYMSGDEFAGYKASFFTKGGIQHTLSIYSPKDLQLANNELVPDRLRFLQTALPEEHKNFIFSITTKMKNKAGFDENYLQRSSFISDQNGKPIGSIGFALKIPLFNADDPVVQLIQEVDIERQQFKIASQKAYYLNEEFRVFSIREKEILLYMADGLSSKMIADKLFISEHTVINHRRNMQSKSNTANAIALVSFAIKNGVI